MPRGVPGPGVRRDLRTIGLPGLVTEERPSRHREDMDFFGLPGVLEVNSLTYFKEPIVIIGANYFRHGERSEEKRKERFSQDKGIG